MRSEVCHRQSVQSGGGINCGKGDRVRLTASVSSCRYGAIALTVAHCSNRGKFGAGCYAAPGRLVAVRIVAGADLRGGAGLSIAEGVVTGVADLS